MLAGSSSTTTFAFRFSFILSTTKDPSISVVVVMRIPRKARIIMMIREESLATRMQRCRRQTGSISIIVLVVIDTPLNLFRWRRFVFCWRKIFQKDAKEMRHEFTVELYVERLYIIHYCGSPTVIEAKQRTALSRGKRKNKKYIVLSHSFHFLCLRLFLVCYCVSSHSAKRKNTLSITTLTWCYKKAKERYETVKFSSRPLLCTYIDCNATFSSSLGIFVILFPQL